LWGVQRIRRPQTASDNNMASALKRKRGPLEAVESSKRSRSNQDIPQSKTELDLSKVVGWEAAFGPSKRQNGGANGVNEDKAHELRDSNSSEVEDFEDLVERARAAKHERKRPKNKAIPNMSTWKTSNPIGGRMIEVDPIFTEDEK
jgi:NET1-associated nuclear protein 1 (U3 small nucleolar RNA-associated protein 17)